MMNKRKIRSFIEAAFKGDLEKTNITDLYVDAVNGNSLEDAVLVCSLFYLQGKVGGYPPPLDAAQLFKETFDLFTVKNKGKDIFKVRLKKKALKSKPAKQGRRPKKDEPCCSFCAKRSKEVKTLIAGPNVFICNECVNICQRVLRKRPAQHSKAKR